MGKCPDCGRVVSLRFPVHTCEPTESWMAENPLIRFIAKASGLNYGGGYLAKKGRNGFTLSKHQRDAIRFPSWFAAEQAAERYDSVSPPPVKRLRLRDTKERKSR